MYIYFFHFCKVKKLGNSFPTNAELSVTTRVVFETNEPIPVSRFKSFFLYLIIHLPACRMLHFVQVFFCFLVFLKLFNSFSFELS